jgi:DNA repair exonuclease SbcCD ATPase subunit
MLEARRDLAAKRERVKAKESLKTLLSRMGLVKGKAAVKVLNSDASTAEQTAALNKYEELLATQREKTAAEIEEYAQASGALQQQSQALTAALEEYGKTVAAALPRAEAVLETTADTGETVEDVQRQLGYVQDTMAALKAREPDLPGLPGVQELEARTAELRQQADAVETPEGLADDIEKITQKLEDFGERIGQPFEQEPLLLEEQQKLLDARATHAGLEARVETLKNLMARIEAEQADLEDTGETDADEASVEEPAADDDAAPAE